MYKMTDKLYICLKAVPVGVLIMSLYFSLFYNASNFKAESSVWCVNDGYSNRMCHFQNVCFNSSTKSFYFYLGDNSIISGLTNYLDLQKIQLSSVSNHNRFFANFTVYSSKVGGQSHVLLISKAIAMARFKPDNLMHVIHDDLFPLFGTLETVCKRDWLKCHDSFNLFFLDENREGPYSFLYQLFSTHPINYFSSLSAKFICFKEVHLGLNTDSLWYQYGFKEPRGPINIQHFNFDKLVRFRQFVLKNVITAAKENFSLILERPSSRKILNSAFIIDSMREQYKGDVVHVNVTKQSAKEILVMVANADILIGIHGAEMILALFMKPQGKIIELFPFGIAPKVVSFLKPLSSFPNCPFSYFSWENLNKSNTIRHPEYAPELGGLKLFSTNERVRISSIDRVHEVYCCTDPTFLHLMYQDTYVGPEFVEIIHEALSTTMTPSLLTLWLYPSRVSSLSCVVSDKATSLSWNPPDNVDRSAVHYEVTVSSRNINMAFITLDTHLVLRGETGSVSVWISAVLTKNNHSSPDTFIHCVPFNNND